MSVKPAPMPMPSQPSVIDTHLLHADHCIQSGQLAPALALYRTAAATAESQGDFPRALGIHSRISRLDPDPSVRLRIGELLKRAGQRSQAADVFEGIVRDEGRANRCAHALVAARAAYDVDPTPTRRWQLGELLAHQGQHAEAVEHLHECAAIELEYNRLRRFHMLARRILGIAPRHVPTLRLVLVAFLRVRDAHRATAVIRTLRAYAPDDRAIFEGTAEVFSILGMPDAAAAALALCPLAPQPLAQGTSPRATPPAPDAAVREVSREPSTMREVTRVLDVADLMDVAPRSRRAPPVRAAV